MNLRSNLIPRVRGACGAGYKARTSFCPAVYRIPVFALGRQFLLAVLATLVSLSAACTREDGSPTISPPASQSLRILSSSSLPGAICGEPYFTRLEAEMGVEPYIWNIVSGQLPEPLQLDAMTAEISGKPSLGCGGTTTITVQVSDAAQSTARKTFELAIAGSKCILSSDTLLFFATEGSTSRRSFWIKNVSPEAIAGTVPTRCSIFEITSGAGNYTLAPGDSLWVSVKLRKFLVCGYYECTLRIGPTCRDVFCVAVVERRLCEPSPTSLNFEQVPVGSAVTLSFTVTNTACVLPISGIVRPDENVCDEGFQIISGGGEFFLNLGESMNVTVRYTAPDNSGASCSILVLIGGTSLCAVVSCRANWPF